MIIVFLLFTIQETPALSVKKECSTLDLCINAISKLTGDMYFHGGKIKGKITATDNLEITKENAVNFLTNILNVNGYTRIPSSGKNTYKIIITRDVRYSSIPQITAGYNKVPKLPNTHDYYMMTYKLKYANTTELTRSFRPFMSRYGRLIDMKEQNILIVQDTAINISRLYKLIKEIDIKPSKEDLKKRKEKEAKKFELDKIRAASCPSPHELSPREIAKKYGLKEVKGKK